MLTQAIYLLSKPNSPFAFGNLGRGLSQSDIKVLGASALRSDYHFVSSPPEKIFKFLRRGFVKDKKVAAVAPLQSNYRFASSSIEVKSDTFFSKAAAKVQNNFDICKKIRNFARYFMRTHIYTHNK